MPNNSDVPCSGSWCRAATPTVVVDCRNSALSGPTWEVPCMLTSMAPNGLHAELLHRLPKTTNPMEWYLVRWVVHVSRAVCASHSMPTSC